MAETVLKVAGISKRFGGLQALTDVGLKTERGQVYGLIGPNGAGKTTLFALMTGFIKPDQGSVRFDGTDITGQAPHLNARLGMARTFQIVQPFAAQTVRENIAVGVHLHERDRRVALEKAGQIAQQVGLADQIEKPASDLTVAGRKRLELARALGTQPKLLLLDEVLAGLNPQEIRDMIPVIKAICASGITVFLIEHVMQAVMSLADHVWVLSQGQLIASGSPEVVTQDDAVVEAYLGKGTAARLRAKGSAA